MIPGARLYTYRAYADPDRKRVVLEWRQQDGTGEVIAYLDEDNVTEMIGLLTHAVRELQGGVLVA